VTSNRLKEFAKRYAKAWCSQNPDSVAAFFAERGSISINSGPPAVGRAALAKEAEAFMTMFPDMILTFRLTGATRRSHGISLDTNRNEQWTGGTGNRVQISGYELWKIDNGAGGSRATWTGKPERVDEQGGESINDGLIRESKGHFDSAEYERQLKHGLDVGRGD
jgi:SnoaL-like domain